MKLDPPFREFEKGERHHFALWLANSVWWEVSLHEDRRERVEVPAGRLDAWRVTAHPQFEGIGSAPAPATARHPDVCDIDLEYRGRCAPRPAVAPAGPGCPPAARAS